MLREAVNLLLENNQELSNAFRMLAILDCISYALCLTEQATNTTREALCQNLSFTVSATLGDHDA